MKKTFLMLSLACLALLTTACGSTDKLVCTKSEDNDKEEITFTFKDGKAYEVEGKTTMSFETEEELKEAKGYSSFLTLGYTMLGAESSVDTKGLDLIVKFNGNIADMEKAAKSLNEGSEEDEDGESALPFSSSMGKEELKEALEAEGYSCK